MTTVEIFDPAMCCSTGVCGPSPDPALITFAGDIEWLSNGGVEVTRHNLGQEPAAFVATAAVAALLNDKGDDALPIVMVDGEARSTGRYPSRDELTSWAGVTVGGAEPAPADTGCGPESGCC